MSSYQNSENASHKHLKVQNMKVFKSKTDPDTEGFKNNFQHHQKSCTTTQERFGEGL